MELSKTAIAILREHGWFPNRDVLGELSIKDRGNLFPAAEKIIGEFGLLEVQFEGLAKVHPLEVFYFDVDESERSKVLRARVFGYDHYSQIDPKDAPDFKIGKDYELQALVSKKLGMPCYFIGTHEEYSGFDMFVVPSGEIYVCHYQDPIKAENSFYEYVNKQIIGAFVPENT